MSSTRPQHRHGFRPKLIALSVAACFNLSATHSQANPTGGSVTSGSASFAVSGNTLTITNSAGAIINWASFSIGVNEITQFLQSSASSAVLNRVVGANGVIPQSVIDGILSSNGRVFLLNQSGILIGSTARLDVAGFVASSLNLSDQDFLNGRLNFTEIPGAGGVSNAGVINTSAGGSVFLVAPDVQNSGIIRSPQGEIVLAAGKRVELISEGSPFVAVTLTADSERALNVGQLLSESGRTGMFGALVLQGGVINADSAVAGPGGEIRLVATRDLTLDAGSLTTANGPSGGNVTLQAQGGTNLISGTVEAKGSSGQGGTIQALGVRVGVIGSGVIDASGDAGGGTVLVGGDQHSDNPSVQNAEQVLIGPDGVIRADAGATGDGGRVIVWSDAETRVYGSISAQGGAQSGNGGFVETSSAGGMDLAGIRVDTRAANGQWGTWLLDPDNVIFEPNSYGAGDPLVYGNLLFGDNPGTTAHVTAGTVETAFGTNGTVRVQATTDVLFNTDLNLSFGTPQLIGFEVRAQNNIDMAYSGGPHTIFTNGHNVTLSANDVGPYASVPTLNTVGTGSIIGGGNVNASYGGGVGGNIVLSGYGVNVGGLQTAGGLDARTQTPTGNVTIAALAGGVQTGSITTSGIDGVDFNAGQQSPATAGASGGNVAISAAYGTVTTGNINTSGGNGGNGGYANSVLVFAGAAGGSGGLVTIGDGTTTSIATGGITANGGAGGYGGSGATMAAITDVLFQVGYGGLGGGGGAVILTSAGNVATGALSLSGGAGGAGGSNLVGSVDGLPGTTSVTGSVEVGRGGAGGNGGSATIIGNDISTGAIVATGGAGADGGTGNSATAIVTAPTGFTLASGSASSGAGGSGGSGGRVDFIGSGSATVAGTIDTGGGAAGAGGANSTANAGVYGQTDAQFAFADASAGLGGSGGGSGPVAIQRTGGGAVSTGAINVAGAAGGTGGDNSSASAYASTFFVGSSFASSGAYAGTGGSGGFASSVSLYGGNVTASGAITTTGGAGGAGSSGGMAAASGYGTTLTTSYGAGTPGFGNFGGTVTVTGTSATLGSIDTSGVSPGDIFLTSATGNLTTGSLTARSLSPAFAGGIVSLQTDTGSILVNGDIDARGSSGLDVLIDSCGDGCIEFVYGGSAGGSISLTRTSTSAAPAGGNAIQVNGSILTYGGNGFSPQGAAGGFGGDGGDVTGSTVFGTVTVTGVVDVHGGYGGAGAAGYAGGAGGFGGSLDLSGDSVTAGTINAWGGAGGAGGADDGVYGGGYGGYGEFGGIVAISSGPYGTSSVGDILAAGGDGGAGGAAGSVLAGTGGDGGFGGSVFVSGGAINVTGNVLDIHSGTGGAGGAGSAVAAGGDGGAGGYGGFAELFSDSQIFVPVAFAANIAGGAGGAGGPSGGAGAGITGASGTIGQFLAIPSLTTTPSPSEPSEPQLPFNTLDESVEEADVRGKLPLSVEEIEKKDKEKKEKKEAVCR